MPSYQNGYVPASALYEVQHGFLLRKPVANAYLALRVAARLHGVAIRPVDAFGSGYRSFHDQQIFYQAAQDIKAGRNTPAVQLANLDPTLQVSIATPGYSSHGKADRADILFNGHSPDASNLALAKKYGFTREFDNQDKNHFQHNLTTAINGYLDDDLVRIVATYLKERHLGKTTNSDQDGDRGPNDGTSHYRWMVQRAGQLDGTYKGRVDGIFADLSKAQEMRYYLKLRQAA